MNSSALPGEDPHSADPGASTLHAIRRLLKDLRFGQITVVIHEGRVVQIERTERFRPPQAEGSG